MWIDLDLTTFDHMIQSHRRMYFAIWSRVTGVPDGHPDGHNPLTLTLALTLTREPDGDGSR